MRSNKKQLHKRGYADKMDMLPFFGYTIPVLIQLLDSSIPTERTIAVRLLAQNGMVKEPEVAKRLLERLSREKCPYPKMEIQRALQQGGKDTAQQMTTYLGQIRSGQYKHLPRKCSDKNGYPMPRDLIARILGKMDEEIYPILAATLAKKDILVLREAVDAVGFFLFYHPQINSDTALENLLKLRETCATDAVLQWKILTALSAFPQQESIQVLSQSAEESRRRLFRQEAERSLYLIENRKPLRQPENEV